MTERDHRAFTDAPAVRSAVPVLLGLVGPSGSGKTYSALRLASGIRRVTGGDIYVIDTESRRALHYAERFEFRHVPFAAPFGPLDYLDAIEHCSARGAKVLVIDSMSHEHEGPGGVLEQHDAEVERLSGGDAAKGERVKMLAWQRPKAARRRLIQRVLQLGINAVFAFRAKEKLKIAPGKPPVPLGWMPIAGEEFLYEMTACCMLLPGAGGVPTWRFDDEARGTREIAKLPEQFRSILGSLDGPLSEDVGAQIATWASGTAPAASEAHERIAAMIATARSNDELAALRPALEAAKAARSVTPAEYRALGAAARVRRETLGADAPREPGAEG